MSKKSTRELHKRIRREAPTGTGSNEVPELKPKRLQGRFSWSSESRFPGVKKAKEEPPLLYLASTGSENIIVSELYLVNNSEEMLSHVSSDIGGFVSTDDDVLTVSGSLIEYQEVAPQEAVLLDYYHQMYDSDYTLALYINVESPTLEKKTFCLTAKGGFGGELLLKADGSSAYLRGAT